MKTCACCRPDDHIRGYAPETSECESCGHRFDADGFTLATVDDTRCDGCQHKDHDGEETRPDVCELCRQDMRDEALAAGIPASVYDRKTNLSDHFSPEYIAWKCGRDEDGGIE